MFFVYPRSQMDKVLSGKTMLRPVPMSYDEAVTQAVQMTGRDRGLITKLMKSLPSKTHGRAFIAAGKSGTGTIIQAV